MLRRRGGVVSHSLLPGFKGRGKQRARDVSMDFMR